MLKGDISKIKRFALCIYCSAQTQTFIGSKPQKHKKLLKDNITNTEKAPKATKYDLNMKAKRIPQTLKQNERINCIDESQEIMTRKDDKFSEETQQIDL